MVITIRIVMVLYLVLITYYIILKFNINIIILQNKRVFLKIVIVLQIGITN